MYLKNGITSLSVFSIIVFMLISTTITAQIKNDVVPATRGAITPASSDKIALLIGNAAYEGENALKTPKNDVAKMETALKKLNFYIVRIDDASRDEMYQVFSVFEENSKQARVAFFYYSGHMVVLNDKNYLVPIDAKINKEENVISQTVALDSMMNNLKARESVIAIDVAYPSHFKFNKSASSNGISFAKPKNFDKGLLSFTTGSNATLKEGESSLFSTYFSKEIVNGFPYVAFLAARTNIKAITNGKQDLAAFGYITNCNTGYGSCSNWKDDTVMSFMPRFAFPWPPPQASARDVIPKGFFSTCKTLGDVNVILRSALDKAEYFEKSYYPIGDGEHGFVVTTRLEQINEDATSIKGTDRWAIKYNERKDISFSKYLSSLFFLRKDILG